MDIHQVVLKRQRQVLTDKEVYQRLMLLRESQVLLLGKLQHRALRQLVHAPLAHVTLLAGVDAKEEIEHDAHHWHKVDHECPGHRLSWLTVVEYHVDHRQNDHYLINYEYDIQPTHFH